MDKKLKILEARKNGDLKQEKFKILILLTDRRAEKDFWIQVFSIIKWKKTWKTKTKKSKKITTKRYRVIVFLRVSPEMVIPHFN